MIDPFFDWHDGFRHRTVVRAELVTATGLRVGAGRAAADAETDLPLLRGANGPFIPGSSIKGAVRSAAEALLRGLGASHGASGAATKRIACDPLSNTDRCVVGLKRDAGREASAASREKGLIEMVRRNICLACATFGAPHLASHVRFHDAPITGSASTMVRDGVAIDRDLGRVAGSLKYDFEVLDPGTVFELRVDLADTRDWQTALVLSVLDELARGHIRLGGFASRGLGVVEVRKRTLHRRELADVLARREGRLLDPGEWASLTEKGFSELQSLVQRLAAPQEA